MSDNKITNQLIINAVQVWQMTDCFHPLTCGKDSSHQNLIAIEINNKVVLKCPDCDYIQTNIPPSLLEFAFSGMKHPEVFKKDT